jgi:hypothetical protein
MLQELSRQLTFWLNKIENLMVLNRKNCGQQYEYITIVL